MKHYLPAIMCLLLVSMGIAYDADATEVKITNPQNGATISQASIDVEGISKDISAGQDLWIMVYPRGVDRYFPQDKRDHPIVMMANGNWSAKAKLDSGLEFKLFAVLSDEMAKKAIIDYLDEPRGARGGSDGMKQLPNGVKVYDIISVKMTPSI